MAKTCYSEWDVDNNCFICTCPVCGETILMTDISREEVDILREGGVIEYWCDECDTTLLVIKCINIKKD